MLFKFFEKANSNLFLENRLLRLAIVVIGAGQIFLGMKVESAMKNQRTILIPANLDRRVMLTGDFASEEYIKMFARNVCTLAFTYTNSGVRSQFGELLQMFAPEDFVTTKQSLQDLATTIETTKTSSVFVPISMKVDPAKGQIVVTGTQRLWIDTSLADTQAKKYVIGYKMVEGRFFVTKLSEDKQQTQEIVKPKNDIHIVASPVNPVPSAKVGAPNAK